MARISKLELRLRTKECTILANEWGALDADVDKVFTNIRVLEQSGRTSTFGVLVHTTFDRCGVVRAELEGLESTAKDYTAKFNLLYDDGIVPSLSAAAAATAAANGGGDSNEVKEGGTEESEAAVEAEAEEYIGDQIQKKLVLMRTKVDAMVSLWECASTVEKYLTRWRETPLINSRPEQVRDEAESMRRTLIRLRHYFERNALPEPCDAADEILKKVDSFMDVDFTLLELIGGPAMKVRHWLKVAKATEMDVRCFPTTCLSDMLQMGLLKHAASSLEDICVVAAKEYVLRKKRRTEELN
jgi:hypothetical protein